MNRFDVYLVVLDPAVGSEIQKTRPGLIVSPDDLNDHLRTVLIAPMTTTVKAYPFRVQCRFGGKKGSIALDQMRAVDKSRLGLRLGILEGTTQGEVLSALAAMFAR